MSDTTAGKKYGFLPQPIGIKHVYCNRSKGGLWYVVEDGKEINLEARSFRSVKGGLKGLTLHEAERGGKVSWKLGLILEGDGDQIYRFETGVGSVFCRGMLFAIASMTPDQVEGEIGLNPTPADPAKMDSAYAKSILYCNMFVNGVEIGSYPGSMDVDWQQLAHQALSIANRCNYPIDNVPHSHVFESEDSKNKPATTGKQWQPATRGMHKPAPTQQPTRPNTQPARSGVTYPNAHLKTQPAPSQPESKAGLEKVYDEVYDIIQERCKRENIKIDNSRLAQVIAESGLSMVEQLTIGTADHFIQQCLPNVTANYVAANAEADRKANALAIAYNELFDKIDENYKLNGLQIDRERLLKAIERGGVNTFQELSTYRKHQIVCTLGKQLILERQPKLFVDGVEIPPTNPEHKDHPAIEVIDSLLMATPLDESVYNTIKATFDSAFSDLMPF